MRESQAAAENRYYRQWEIAAAREQTAYPCAFVAAFFAAIAAHALWSWWLWTACAGAWVFAMCTYGYASDTAQAWEEYETRADPAGESTGGPDTVASPGGLAAGRDIRSFIARLQRAAKAMR